MPNHVTHRVVITGLAKAITMFKSTFLTTAMEKDHNGTEQPCTFLDFEVLAPMPDLIRQTESSLSVNDGLLVLDRSDIRDEFGLTMSQQERVDLYLSYPWVKEAGVTDLEGLKSLLLARNSDCLEKGQRAIEAYEIHGHSSWYSWSITNWATMWNSYGFHMVSETDDRLEFLFDTALSTSEPIFAALAARPEVKDLALIIHAFDERWNFAYVGSISNGHYLGQVLQACEALYQDVYGHPSLRGD